MNDESRAEKFLELFNKGKEFTEELLRENQRLRYRLAAVESEGASREEVDRLFRTASESCNDRLIAVIMTGMGDDGSEAIRQVRQRGGRTIAESAESAIIFGMPGEAIKTGAVDEVLSLTAIPNAIRRLCTGS